jgi:valyl-tRNA synthetase
VPGFDPAGCQQTVNRWIVGALADAAGRVNVALDEFKFNDAAGALYQFTWGNFCDWYLEFAKPIFTGTDEAAKAETRAVTTWVLSKVVHLLHPIMPFLTEAVWEHLSGGKSGLLITAPWPELVGLPRDAAAMAEMDWVVSLISAVRGVRSEMNVPGGTEIVSYIRSEKPEVAARLARHGDAVRRLARLKSINKTEGAGWEGMSRQAVQVVVEGATLFLDLASAVDLEKERARLRKEADTVTGELDKIARKLGNEQFIAKAKPEVIEEQRERHSEGEAALARIRTALERLGAG